MPTNKQRGVPVILLIVAVLGAVRFSRQVRAVDAPGLFASGALVGVSVGRLIGVRTGQGGPR